MTAISQEWKNNTLTSIYKKNYKKNVENYGWISLFNACYKIYSHTEYENLKAQEEMYPLNARMDSERQIFHRSIV